MFGFTGLTVINPRIQFICFAPFPNFAEVHRTEQIPPPSHPKDTGGYFFVWKKKHKTAFHDYIEEQNTTKPHSTLNSPGTGWASGASLGAPAAAWSLVLGGPWHSHCCCCSQDQRHWPSLALLWNAQLSCRHTATEKNKHTFAFWLDSVLHHITHKCFLVSHSQEWGSLASLEAVLKTCIFYKYHGGPHWRLPVQKPAGKDTGIEH